MRELLERIEFKLDRISEDITELKVDTAVNTQRLKEYEEDKIKIEDLHTFKSNVIGVSKFISVCGIIATIAMAVKQYI